MDWGAPMSLRFISDRNVDVMNSEIVGLGASNTRPRSHCNMDSKDNNPVRNKRRKGTPACDCSRYTAIRRIHRVKEQRDQRTAARQSLPSAQSVFSLLLSMKPPSGSFKCGGSKKQSQNKTKSVTIRRRCNHGAMPRHRTTASSKADASQRRGYSSLIVRLDVSA